jgi:hypothetical protein
MRLPALQTKDDLFPKTSMWKLQAQLSRSIIEEIFTQSGKYELFPVFLIRIRKIFPGFCHYFWRRFHICTYAAKIILHHSAPIILLSFKSACICLPVLRIRDVYPESRSKFFPSRIQGQKDSRIRIRIKELSIVSNGMFISDPDLDFLPFPDPGSRGQKGTVSRPGSGSATLISSVSFSQIFIFSNSPKKRSKMIKYQSVDL